MENILYGDGIHDDTAAIQQLLDTACEVRLPMPKVHYRISRPLELPSNCKLCLPRFAEIRLAPGADCVMVQNKMQEEPVPIQRTEQKLFSFYNRYSPDHPVQNIEIEGGIWNFNNKHQSPNPIGTYKPVGYSGFGMLFYNVRGLRLSALTLKDPVNFAVTLDTVSYFSVENITFDFNDGNPWQSNMDGIHLNGNCHHGTIERLFGTCYDDTVALNAEEGSCGSISHITIRGIYTENAYSAVRLLCARPECVIRNVHIADVHGTFYHFGICFMRAYNTGLRGAFENISIDHVYASKADRGLVKFPAVTRYRQYALIDVESLIDIRNLTITEVHRRETVDSTAPTLQFAADTVIHGLHLQDITAENAMDDTPMPFLVNHATITGLQAAGLYADGCPVDV